MKRNYFMVRLLIVSLVLMLGACATTPQGPPPTYRITTKPVADGFLQGKKAVIFNIVTAERGKASAQPRQGGQGIFGVIGAGVATGRVIAFNRRASRFDDANKADLQEFTKVLDEAIATVWKESYGAETVQAAHNVSGILTKAVKKQIADICAQNNAEFAVSIIQQITHGYLHEESADLLVGTGKMIAQTQISAQITVFDNKGNIAIQAIARMPSLNGSLALSPNNGEQYAQLYIAGALNILNTILALDPSSAAFSMDDLMEALIIQLETTEDDEDE